MARREILDRIQKYVDPFRITKGKGFRLKNVDPGDTCGLQLGKGEAAELLATRHQVARGRAGHALRPGQLVAAARVSGDGCGRQGRHHQARHVGRQSAGMPGVLVQAAFARGPRPRLPVALRQVPARARAHRHLQPFVLRGGPRRACAPGNPERQRLPAQNVGKRIWDDRLADIAHFEDYLARQGTIILKFFLHVSREEQKKRFMERLDKPRKHWKFSSADIRERGFWGDYMQAFEEAIRTTAAPHAPWFIVPADNKWFTRLVVAAAIVEAVEKLDLTYPKIDAAKKKELAAARAALARER